MVASECVEGGRSDEQRFDQEEVSSEEEKEVEEEIEEEGEERG